MGGYAVKPIIISPYMTNIDPVIVQHQKQAVEHLTKQITFVQYLTNKSHGKTMDELIDKAYRLKYDCILFMDIDAIPLSYDAIVNTLVKAHGGTIIGNVQRSNHIQNNEHVFVAPSFMGISPKVWHDLGRPSFEPTFRGDVAEEITYAAEAHNVPYYFYMPISVEAAPIEAPNWKLKTGWPVYGCGTTFADGRKPVSYHAFQISHGRNKENFIAKCQQVMMS
jgi:hypothetical protein